MNIKVFKVVAIALIAIAVSVNYYAGQRKGALSGLTLSNVEALANQEMSLECDNYSQIIKCQKMCLSCGTVWTAVGGYGNAGKLKGTCKCGIIYS